MMRNTYQLVTVPSARRSLKKLSLPVRRHILKAIQTLENNPNYGEQLEGQWRFLRSFHTVYRRTHYRIVYEVDKSNKQVIIRFAASRENFYRPLLQLKMKSLS
jgi:mRNA-degrading endonuclease RelE of RelBE toxin-antitoxin system